jgi:uncharacterized protein (TIGR04222 family)
MRGPDFLGFYLVFFGMAVIAAGLLRWYFRAPGGAPSRFELELSPYETAYLAGGRELALNAAIAKLMKEKVLDADPLGRSLLRRSSALIGGSPLERAIYSAIGEGGESIARVRSAAAAALAPMEAKLLSLDFILGPFWETIARFVPFMIAISPPFLGVLKICVGVSRSKPVIFLFIFVIVSLIVASVLFLRPVLRSRRGDSALRMLKHDNAAVGYAVQRSANRLSGDDLVLGLGLFGVGILAGSELDSLHKMLKPHPQSGSSGCGTSGCGGGGCGGGGGGGGCGGGCGGCGG